MSGEVEEGRAGQRCVPGLRHTKRVAASASVGSWKCRLGPHPGLLNGKLHFHRVLRWFVGA